MPVPGDFFRATYSFEAEGGSAVMNVFHFRLEAGSASSCTDSQLLAGIAAWITTLYDGLVGYVANGTSTPLLEIEEIGWNGSYWGVQSYIGAQALGSLQGTGTGNPLPAGVAALIRAIPVYVKRAGRKFIGGLTVGVIETDGSFVDAFLTALASAAASYLFKATITIDGSNMFAAPVMVASNMSTYVEPTTVVVSSNPVYQRRRRLGVGL